MENTNKTTADVVKNVRRSVSSILWDKFLDTLERHSWKSIGVAILEMLLAIVLAVSMFDIPSACSHFVAVVKWGDYALPKTLGAHVLVFGWRVWFWWLRSGWLYLCSLEFAPTIREDVPTFYGIPVIELVDYLFSGDGSFRRDDIEARFALPRNRFDAMAKKMDSVGIFSRGENNARVLNADFSRSDVSSMLFSAALSGELRPLMRQESPCSWTSAPSMPVLRDRVVPSPTSESGFVIRPLDVSAI